MMEKVIRVVPHDEQRYDTVGDYAVGENGDILFFVSDTGDDDYNFLIGLHEQIEEHLTRRRGLTEPTIMAFDEQFEAERAAGLHGDDEEPGFADDAPYRREHTLATAIEMQLAAFMGINWNTYDKAVMSLGQDAPLSKDQVEGVFQPC